MRPTRLAARLDFAQRFTFAVIDQPFLTALRRVSALPCASAQPMTTAAPVAAAARTPEIPRAA